MHTFLELIFNNNYQNKFNTMNIQAQKTLIIEQFQQIDDINLIKAIKNLLDFALQKKQEDIVINEEHKEIVRDRIRKIDADPSRLMDWDVAKKTLKT